jgi:hypothetical protein
MMKSEMENIMKTGLEGWKMEVRVSALLRDLLGVLGFTTAVCKWGRQHR